MEGMNELKDLFEQRKTVASYGIKYLDDTLGGIHKGELILIGARSGAGKSTLARKIARHNSAQGKKITLLSLEDYKGDALFKGMFYTYRNISKSVIEMEDFRNGRKVAWEIMKKCYDLEKEKMANITLIEREDDEFTIQKIADYINQAGEAGDDLVIIDHLDYVDKDNPRDDENTHVTELMKAIRSTQSRTNIPIIAFSHLRKMTYGKQRCIIPSMDDFIGTSNKVKQATQVIMFAPDEESNMTNFMSPYRRTWCCVRKDRMGGWKNEAAKLKYNMFNGQYEEEYELFGTNYEGSEMHAKGVNNDQ